MYPFTFGESLESRFGDKQPNMERNNYSKRTHTKVTNGTILKVIRSSIVLALEY